MRRHSPHFCRNSWPFFVVFRLLFLSISSSPFSISVVRYCLVWRYESPASRISSVFLFPFFAFVSMSMTISCLSLLTIFVLLEVVVLVM